MPVIATARKLDIDVYVIGQQDAVNGSFGATVTYVAAHMDPPTPGLVDFRTGNINLNAIPLSSRNDPKYLMEIDIIFTLKASIFDKLGNAVPAIFATPTAQYGCLVLNPHGNPPHSMSVSSVSDVKIKLDDDNAEGDRPTADRTYSYGLGIVLPSQDNYFISLDPTVLKSGPH